MFVQLYVYIFDCLLPPKAGAANNIM